MQRIQMQLSPNQKIFAQFFSAFPEFTQKFDYLEKKMRLGGDLFVILQTVKSGVS